MLTNSNLSEIASMSFLKNAGYTFLPWASGGDMSKKAKRGKAEALALPMAGKVAVVAIAVAALGYGLLSRPASVQPVPEPPARQALLPLPLQGRTAAPTPVPAPASAPASQVEQKFSDAPGKLVRQVVDYVSHEAQGTVVIDTENTVLYLVLNGGQAMRYGIGVGREGFTWSGEQSVARKTEWPDWRPPADMLTSTLPTAIYGGRPRQSARGSGDVSG